METAVIMMVGFGTSFTFLAVGMRLNMYRDHNLRARAWLWLAAGSGVQIPMDLLLDTPAMAVVMSAGTAFALYNWWNNGGGDGMRRAWQKAKSLLSMSSSLPQTA